MPSARLLLLLLLVIAAALAAGTWLALRWWDRRALQPDAVLVYRQVEGHALALHLFRPPTPTPPGPRPALLLFHGGGWAQGDPSQFHLHCRHWSRQGLVCISAAYRLSGVHGSTPADALQDTRAAMRHLRRHAVALGIDGQRIGAGGGSAGGHLAAALAAGVPWPDPEADPAAPTRPDVLVLLNPMLDLSPGMPDHDRVGEGWRALSPLQHVGPGMPPTLVLSGDRDPEVAVSTVQAFCRAVQAQGGDCDLQVLPGAGHGFFNPGVDGGRHVATSLARVDRFLAKHLLRPAGPAGATPR